VGSWIVGLSALRRLKRMETDEGPRPGVWVGVVPMLYVLCLGITPLNFIVGAVQLNGRTLARQGAATLLFSAVLVAVQIELVWERVLRWAIHSP
jgi:hypothetical protein